MYKILSLILIFLISCGKSKVSNNNPDPEITIRNVYCTVNPTSNGAIITCPDGSSQEILNGEQGKEGQSSIIFNSFVLDNFNTCLSIKNVWIENKNNRLSVYNNNQCKSNPYPDKAICSNLKPNSGTGKSDICFFNNTMFITQKSGKDMFLHILEF